MAGSMEKGDERMIYALLMTAGILEFIFAAILVLHFFDHEAEIEAAYQDGYTDGFDECLLSAGLAEAIFDDLDDPDVDVYYDALVDEANCWFGMDGDMR